VLIKEIKVGDTVKIPVDERSHPEGGHFGKCVWISEDGITVAVQCGKSHNGKKNTVSL